MAAIMEFTRYNNAVDGVLPVRKTFYDDRYKDGNVMVQLAGKNPGFKVGEKVSVYNKDGRYMFTGPIWYIYQGPTAFNLYVKHGHAKDPNWGGFRPDGGYVQNYQGNTDSIGVPKAYNPDAPGSGTGSAADELHAQEEQDVLVNENGEVVGEEGLDIAPAPTMASVLPAGLDVKKVGIGLAIVAVAYFAYKKFGGKK